MSKRTWKPTPAAFSQPISPIHTFFAMMILLGSVHLTVILVVTSYFLLPLQQYYVVLGMILMLMLIPIDENSKLGLALARYICQHVPGYFPATIYVEDVRDFIHDHAYVFVYEHHSVWPIEAGLLSALIDFMPKDKVKVLASRALLYTPFLRHLCTWFGTKAATKEEFSSFLKAGYSCILTPSGVHEAFCMQNSSKVRKGFIRLAMETNSPVVPLFAFGQSYDYNSWKPRRKFFRKLSQAIKFMPIVFWCTLWLSIPLRRPTLVVLGKPIHFNKKSTPTRKEVSEAHDQFVKTLQSLFDRHKTRAGYPDLKLRIM